jgi:hypothetical protein
MECFKRENLRNAIAYTCGIAFDFSKNGSFYSDKIYIEVSHKKNAMYGEIGISKGYRFQLCTNDKNKFRFWANHDTFSIPTNKEGVEYHISANSIDELKEKVIDAIYDILPQYK